MRFFAGIAVVAIIITGYVFNIIFIKEGMIEMKIEILGMGCKKCADLYESTKAAIDELQMNTQISKVEDFKEIMKYGVMTTPALVVDGTVKVWRTSPQ